MNLVGFKLNGETYRNPFTKDGNTYIAELKNGKVRISKLSSVCNELCMSLPLEVEAEDFWYLKKEK